MAKTRKKQLKIDSLISMYGKKTERDFRKVLSTLSMPLSLTPKQAKDVYDSLPKNEKKLLNTHVEEIGRIMSRAWHGSIHQSNAFCKMMGIG